MPKDSTSPATQPPKYFVIDTNVLIHNPKSIFAFQGNNIIIPYVVIEELDDLKKKNGIIGKHARDSIRLLDSIRSIKTLSDWVEIDNDIRIKIEMNHINIPEMINLPAHSHKDDNRIISVAFNYRKNGFNAIIVSKDLSLRLKADLLGIPAEDFESDKID